MNPIIRAVDGQWLQMWCPGCETQHQVGVARQDTGWTWNSDLDHPTIQPSIRVSSVQWAEGESFHKRRHKVPAGGQTVCHSFIRDGRWEFLADCTHDLAGQTVQMVPLPDWLVDA